MDRPDHSPGNARSDSGSARPPEPEEVPLGQRLFERPFVLLVLGIVIMAAFYTGWGLYEIASMTPSPLP